MLRKPEFEVCFRVQTISQVSHRMIWFVLSHAVDASRRPSKEKDTSFTSLVCLSSVCKSLPLVASHRRIVLSLEAEARRCPSGDHATSTTLPLCPCMVCTYVLLPASHIRRVSSSE